MLQLILSIMYQDFTTLFQASYLIGQWMAPRQCPLSLRKTTKSQSLENLRSPRAAHYNPLKNELCKPCVPICHSGLWITLTAGGPDGPDGLSGFRHDIQCVGSQECGLLCGRVYPSCRDGLIADADMNRPHRVQNESAPMPGKFGPRSVWAPLWCAPGTVPALILHPFQTEIHKSLMFQI